MRSELSREQVLDLLHYLGSPKIRDNGVSDNIQFCCTVHAEETPSAGISIDKQIFHCFACGASGTISWLVFKSLPDEFKSMKQVYDFLRDRYNVDVNSYSRKVRKDLKKYEDFFDSENVESRFELPMTKIAPFKSGKETYEYFFDRGFSKETMKSFKIGRDLISQTVTVPIFWEDEKLAGIIGRYVDPNRPKNARYKVYDFPKGSILFPLNKFELINDEVILVEGVFDAMWLHQLGFTNALAILGDQITKAQADIVKSLCNKVVDMFDNDAGGDVARSFARKKLGKDVLYYTVEYPVGKKDPADCTFEEVTKMLEGKKSILKREISRL